MREKIAVEHNATLLVETQGLRLRKKACGPEPSDNAIASILIFNLTTSEGGKMVI